MEYTKENLQELAESIYDLDAEVYAQLGSSLGRVFNRDREGCVSDMVQLMLRKDSHQLRSELALISNMARTIEDKGTRSMIMTEYNRILKEVIALPTSFASGDILDAKAAGLNALQFKARFGKDNHRIICISRTYGCGGNEIGFMLADKLKINYYDAEIFSAVLKRLQADQDEQIRDNAAYPADKANQEVAFAAPRRMTLKERIREFSRYHGLSKRDAVFFNQSDLICDMAKKEDFIVMGRCADVILKDYHPLNLFIYADMEAKVERCIRRAPEGEHLTRNEIERMIKQVDKNRAQYRQMYSDTKWGAKESYHLCVNTTERYMKEIVPGLAAYVRCWFSEE